LVGDLANTGLKAGFREGLRSICWILGLVGVSLGAANLLPIPALDGGFIVMGLVELVRGKRLRPHTYARLQNLGAIVIILIFLVAIIGDFKYFL
jgi:regulator of sigma E protease